MPRPCALAALAAPYLAGLWRLFLERPGLALEGASWLAELALRAAPGLEPPAPALERAAEAEEAGVSAPLDVDTPCVAPEGREAAAEEQACECESCAVCPAAVECAPCPAPERCPEFEGPPWVEECEPPAVLDPTASLEQTPTSWLQVGFGAVVTFVSGVLANCGCRPAPWQYGARRAHYSLARAHVRGVFRG